MTSKTEYRNTQAAYEAYQRWRRRGHIPPIAVLDRLTEAIGDSYARDYWMWRTTAGQQVRT